MKIKNKDCINAIGEHEKLYHKVSDNSKDKDNSMLGSIIYILLILLSIFFFLILRNWVALDMENMRQEHCLKGGYDLAMLVKENSLSGFFLIPEYQCGCIEPKELGKMNDKGVIEDIRLRLVPKTRKFRFPYIFGEYSFVPKCPEIYFEDLYQEK